MAVKFTDLPAAGTPSDGDLYAIVQGATSRKQTLAQLSEALGISGTNLQALLNLVGAADRLPYFNGEKSLALAAFTAAGRQLVGSASLADMLNLLLASTALPVNQGGTGGTTATAARTGIGAAARPNLLTNPGFKINQRGYVSGTNTTVAFQATVDRWRVVTSGENLAFSAANTAANVATAPAGGLDQVVEGLDIPVAGVHTLSWSGTATATVNGTAVTNGGQTPVLPAGVDVNVKFIGGTVSLPKLEFGSVASAYEARRFSEEFKLCERFFESGNLIFSANVTSAAAYIAFDKFKQRKRATPVVVLTNVSATSFPTTLPTPTVSVVDVRIAQAANASAMGFYNFSYTADAEYTS